MKTRNINVIEMAFEEIANDYQAKWLEVGKYFKYLNGIYVTIKVDATENYVDAVRLDEKESILTEIPGDTNVIVMIRIESL